MAHASVAPTAFDVPSSQLSAFQQTYARSVLNQEEKDLRVFSLDFITASTGTSRLGYRFEGQGILSGWGSQTMEPTVWVEAPEAKLTYQALSGTPDFPSLKMRVEVGRAKHDWSRLDSEWSLGLWQSRSRWDYFSPRQVGLEGAFLHAKSDRFEATVFASYLYVPERGPELLLENGKFRSTQFGPGIPPTESEIFSGVPTDIRYEIHMPSYAKLLLQPSLGTQVSYRARRGPYLQAAVADKPIRQIQTSFNGYNDMAGDVVPVDVVPHVDRHTIAALDGGYTFSGAELGVSLLGEHPRQQLIPTGRTHAILNDAFIAGASGRLSLSAIGLRHWSLVGGYLRRWGGRVGLTGDQASAAGGSVEPRHLYREAVSFGFDIGDEVRSPIRVRSRLIQELNSSATWLSFNVRALALNQHLGFLFGVDILGSETVRADDFISRMKTGDRVMGGVSYVF